MRVKIHPDGFVRVRDRAAVLYVATLDEFKADFGTAAPPLPKGMVCAEYDTDTNILVYSDERGNAHPVEGVTEWKFGEAVAARVQKLAAAKVERLAAASRAAVPAAVAAVPDPAPAVRSMSTGSVKRKAEVF